MKDLCSFLDKSRSLFYLASFLSHAIAYSLFISVYLVELGASGTVVGMLFFLSSFVDMAFLVLVGILCDVLGYKKMLFIAFSLSSLGNFALGSSRNLTEAFIAVIVLFASSSAYLVASKTAIAKHFRNEKRGKGYGLLHSVFALSNIVGPFVTGIIAHVYGLSFMFLVAGFTSFAHYS